MHSFVCYGLQRQKTYVETQKLNSGYFWKMRFVGREFQEGFSEEVFLELRSGDKDVR